MLQVIKFSLALICITGAANSYAETVMMNFTASQGTDKSAGTIQITETKHGLLFTPKLQGISSGIHGFHVHLNPDCANNGMAAKGHFDPTKSNKHLGPYDDKGHLGDLPALYATAEGMVDLPVLAPRIKHVSEIKGHALMVHSGGDNYSDAPQPLGGGSSRMVCGIIK